MPTAPGLVNRPDHISPQTAVSNFRVPPEDRRTTITAKNFSQLEALEHDSAYGRHKTATQDALESLLIQSRPDNGAGVVLYPSGVAAITYPMIATLKPGDHLFVADNVYGNTREFCDVWLKEHNISVSYFDPTDAKGLEKQIARHPNGKGIFFEIPGSGTFEVPDTEGIVALAKKKGLITYADTTYLSPIHDEALNLGVDISLQALTKYPDGQSATFLGAAFTQNKALWNRMHDSASELGNHVDPHACREIAEGMKSRKYCTRPTRIARGTSSGETSTPAGFFPSSWIINTARPRWTRWRKRGTGLLKSAIPGAERATFPR